MTSKTINITYRTKFNDTKIYQSSYISKLIHINSQLISKKYFQVLFKRSTKRATYFLSHFLWIMFCFTKLVLLGTQVHSQFIYSHINNNAADSFSSLLQTSIVLNSALLELYIYIYKRVVAPIEKICILHIFQKNNLQIIYKFSFYKLNKKTWRIFMLIILFWGFDL